MADHESACIREHPACLCNTCVLDSASTGGEDCCDRQEGCPVVRCNRYESDLTQEITGDMLRSAADMIKKEIRKHEMDLQRAIARQNVQQQEIDSLRGKIFSKKLLLTLAENASKEETHD